MNIRGLAKEEIEDKEEKDKKEVIKDLSLESNDESPTSSSQMHGLSFKSIAEAIETLNKLSTIKRLTIDHLNINIVAEPYDIQRIKDCISIEKNITPQEEPLIALNELGVSYLIAELNKSKPELNVIQELLDEITALHLSKCGINNRMIKVLAKILPHIALKELDLSYNPISREGAKALAEYLKDNTTLVTFKSKGITWGGSKGQEDILRAFYQNKHLSLFDLNGYDLASIRKRNKALSCERKKYLEEKFPVDAQALTCSLEKKEETVIHDVVKSYLGSDLTINEGMMFINNVMPQFKWKQHAIFSDCYQVFFANKREADRLVSTITAILNLYKVKLKQYIDAEKQKIILQLIPVVMERIDGVFAVTLTIPQYERFILMSFKDKWYCKDIFFHLANISNSFDQNQRIEYKENKKNLHEDNVVIQLLKPLYSFKSRWLTKEVSNQRNANQLYNVLIIQLEKIEKELSRENQINLFGEVIKQINTEIRALKDSCQYAEALHQTQEKIYMRYECLTCDEEQDVRIKLVP